MDMTLVLVFSTGLAISQAFLLLLFFAPIRRNSLQGNLIVLFLLCLISVLLVTLPNTGTTPFSYTLGRLATGLPAVLWLLAFFYFADRQKVPVFMWLILGSHWVLRGIRPLIDTDEHILYYLFTHAYPLVAMVLLLFHSIFLAVKGFREDLVEERRTIRGWFVLSMGIIYLGIIFNRPTLRNLLNIELDPQVPAIIVALTVFASIAGLLRICATVEGDLFSRARVSVANGSNGDSKQLRKDKIASQIIDKVRQNMEEDKLYRESDLSIGEMATRLGVAEYQLRRVINKELHYRNFGQFVNSYRLQEARERLIHTDLPVSTIAMEVGFSALSSFYRTFKETYHETPKEYRSRHLPGEAAGK